MNTPSLDRWRLYQALYQQYIRKLPPEKIQEILRKEGSA